MTHKTFPSQILFPASFMVMTCRSHSCKIKRVKKTQRTTFLMCENSVEPSIPSSISFPFNLTCFVLSWKKVQGTFSRSKRCKLKQPFLTWHISIINSIRKGFSSKTKPTTLCNRVSRKSLESLRFEREVLEKSLLLSIAGQTKESWELSNLLVEKG